MKKIIFSVLVSAAFILYLTTFYRVITKQNSNTTDSFESILERKELVVAIDENQPGYFVLDGLSHGFQYDVLKQYCQTNNISLKVVPAISSSNSIAMLENREIDVACVMSDAMDGSEMKTHVLNSIFNSNFVVMTSTKLRKQSPKTLSMEELSSISKGKSVVMTQNFTATESYDKWLDSVNYSATISYDTPLNLISELSDGSIDFLVCNKTDAMVGMTRNKNVSILHTFDEQVSSMLLVKVGNKTLEESFNKWFGNFSTSEEFAILTALYYDDRFVNDLVAKSYIKPVDGISRYDEIIKQKSKELGFDWRLVSAIAYNESRFNPSVKSKRGATGLMQIMPRIAKQFNVTAEEIHDPSNNIEVALLLLNKIKKSLRFPKDVSKKDQISIILACYNGGIGHVLDARRLAVKFGYDPNKWENISTFLKAKNDAIFYEDEAVKSGKFKGGETISFVSNVWRKYDQYCKIADK